MVAVRRRIASESIIDNADIHNSTSPYVPTVEMLLPMCVGARLMHILPVPLVGIVYTMVLADIEE